MPGCHASKDRLTLLLGANNAAGDFKLELKLIYHFENPRALRNYTKSTLPLLCKWNNKAWMIAYLFAAWFTILSPVLRLTSQKKIIPFKTTAHCESTWSSKSSSGNEQGDSCCFYTC